MQQESLLSKKFCSESLLGFVICCYFCFGNLSLPEKLHLTRLNVKDIHLSVLVGVSRKVQPLQKTEEDQGPKYKPRPLSSESPP